ncbi:SCO2521 family protein [Nocardia bovistercoris]|uniref:Uncharacterized protein n=1 Tax=Nocardia bovistercoris TaxID=2785916 RepID=A0A931I8A9_9NOCA|nr:SCO2521 family protein [Nocardia bovistercoris]MBH0775710.1 hypothetical protein [Nocardia bovistercoris]
MRGTLVVLGEVRTCLLPAMAAVNRAEANDLLALMPGRVVRWKERPGRLAISPALAVGVDCNLTAGTGTPRIVGTVATNATLVGGRILQSSSHTRVVRATERQRQTWSHYISQKGVTELIGPLPERDTAPEDLTEGYLAARAEEDSLDLATITARLLSRITADARLDHQPPLQARTTRLRWAARIGGSSGPSATMLVDDEEVRSIRLVLREADDLDAAQRFCEDLAAHDWLLTTLVDILEEADRYPSASRERREILAPALEHLTGLWMPGGHTPAATRTLWKELQNEPGFTRQWTTLVSSLRDNIAVATLAALR